jgi:hypothetical protein
MSKEMEGAQCQMQKRNNSVTQKWTIQYPDESVKIPTKGFNEQFGFHCNKPFYFRSRLPMKRVVECRGANNVILKKYRKD